MVNRESINDYDEFYKNKELPATESEGEIQVIGFDDKHLLSILQGRIGSVIGGLKQTSTKRKLKAAQCKALKETITYFENHRKWMHYDEYLASGYPIGSGVVESTCAHTVKKRRREGGVAGQ